MTQLQLLQLRPQPEQKTDELKPHTIRAFVRERLRDFPRRQRQREAIRKVKQAQYEAKATMTTIRVTFRTVFNELKPGLLNPMGAKMRGPFPVELYRRGEFWNVREIASPARRTYAKLADRYKKLEDAQADLVHYFGIESEPWQIWGEPPAPKNGSPSYQPAPRMLEPSEICDLGEGKFGWYGPKDRLHIFHPQGMTEEERALVLPPAACHERNLDAKYFISNRANVEPSCPGCAEVWRREYQGK